LQAANVLATQLFERSPDTNRAIKHLYHRIWSVNERKVVAKETINQIKIITGKNQRITVKRELGQSDIGFKLSVLLGT
jgi:hypothetical protein